MEQSPIEMNEPPAWDRGPEVGQPGENLIQDDFAEQQDFQQAAGATPGGPRFNRTTFALAGLFLAGIAVIAYMSLRDGPKQVSADEKAVQKKVEGFIAKREESPEAGESAQNTQDVVEAFHHYESRRQVPLDDLKSNPFVFGHPEEDAGGSANRLSAEEKAAAERREALTKELARFKLQSVMIGPRGGTAIINNNFLIEGQTLGSFTVGKIHRRSVNLTADEMAFTLQLEQ